MTGRFLKPGAAWVLLGAPGLALLLWLMQRGLRALGNRGGTASEGLLLGLLIGIFLAVAVAYLWSTRLLGRSTATVRHQPALLRVLEFQVRRLAARVLGRRGERWFGWALNAPYENQALAYLDEAARCGNVEALLELGLYWRDAGLGVGGDASARAWFRRAAELGHGEAAFHLAECLRWGRGGLREPQEAHRWYLRAAQRGFGPAAAWLARAYAEGDGVSADPEEAAGKPASRVPFTVMLLPEPAMMEPLPPSVPVASTVTGPLQAAEPVVFVARSVPSVTCVPPV